VTGQSGSALPTKSDFQKISASLAKKDRVGSPLVRYEGRHLGTRHYWDSGSSVTLMAPHEWIPDTLSAVAFTPALWQSKSS
jgi:hypothetical protein